MEMTCPLACEQGKREGKVSIDLWSSLLDDILRLIADKIELIEDYVSFCAVCRVWYTCGRDFYEERKKLDFKTPFYMFGIDPHYDPYPHLSRSTFSREVQPSPNLTFRSILSKRNFVLNLPEAAGRRCWGSQFGWLVTYGVFDGQFSLLNPFSRAVIPLPSMNSFPDFPYDPPNWFLKAILTADPVDDDCVVLLIVRTNARLARYVSSFAKPGRDNTWTPFSCGIRLTSIYDAVSFQGKLYGVSVDFESTVSICWIKFQSYPRMVELVRINISDPSLGLDGRDLGIDMGACLSKKYLVELNGELCLVVRYIVGGSSTGYFKAFNIHLPTYKLTRVWSLADHCLFLGNNNTFACKVACPPPKAFEQLEHPPARFMNNHVFYTYEDDWLSFIPRVERVTPFFPDEGVWDMLRSYKVYSSTEALTRYPPLWMIPSISFPRLEVPL